MAVVQDEVKITTLELYHRLLGKLKIRQDHRINVISSNI
jgi:hypothetical protein